MNDVSVLIGGLRGLLFSAAAVSAFMFIGEFQSVWSILCTIMRKRVQRNQIIAIAALGWFITACASMALSAPRLYQALFNGRSPAGISHGWDAVWLIAGFGGLSVGFYLPVLAMLWYRNQLSKALALGVFEIVIGIIFAWLAATMH